MQLKIIVTGKLKEKTYKSISEEFEKRTRPYCSAKIIEIPAENLKTAPSEKVARDREGQKILNQISDDAFVFALEIEGKNLSSEQLASKVKDLSNTGLSEMAFIIGGATGLSDDVKKRADFSLSFSKMTFTHQFARLMLQEQIYRAFKIINNEPYHK